MSLWTPDGEHEIPDEHDDTQVGFDPDQELDPETQAQLEEELARAQAQLLSAPVEQVVSNHVMGLFEMAALHLRVGNTDAARLPIDAMGLLVDNLGDRLAEAETLTAALAQLRMAYVEVMNNTADDEGDLDDDEE